MYNANKHTRRKNWCVIFATLIGWSTIHDIYLSDDDIDDVYRAINRTRGKWWFWRIDIPKIIKHLDSKYNTLTHLLYPRDWRWNSKTKRNLSKWMYGLVSLRINDDFKRAVANGTMSNTDWVNQPFTVWHHMWWIIENWKYYLIDIFYWAKKYNEYLVQPEQFEALKKSMEKDFIIITK